MIKLIAFLKICSKIEFHFNSAVNTGGNDHELIEILSSPEGSPEKKR